MGGGIAQIRISSNLKINIYCLHGHKIEFFCVICNANFPSERNMESPNLDFFDFGLDFILMFMIYRMGLFGQFLSFVNSTAVKYVR